MNCLPQRTLLQSVNNCTGGSMGRVDRVDRAARLVEARRLSQMLVTLAERSRSDFIEAVESLGLPLHLPRALLPPDTPAAMSGTAYRPDCNRSDVHAIADP